MNVELLMTLAIIHAVALASPGPDFALIVKLASQESRKVSLAAAAGIATAILGHTVLSLTGVSLVIKSSETLFLAVQLLGLSYLTWMGIGAIRAAVTHWRDKFNNEETAPLSASISVKKGFLQGLYTNLLNPKAMIFFVTLFSALVTPAVSVNDKFLIALIFVGLTFFWFAFIALVLSKPVIQQKVKNATPVINLVTGILFVSVSVAIVSDLF